MDHVWAVQLVRVTMKGDEIEKASKVSLKISIAKLLKQTFHAENYIFELDLADLYRRQKDTCPSNNRFFLSRYPRPGPGSFFYSALL